MKWLYGVMSVAVGLLWGVFARRCGASVGLAVFVFAVTAVGAFVILAACAVGGMADDARRAGNAMEEKGDV